MGMNFENVAKALGISKKSAQALDALDGKSDKQVKHSVYDETAKLLNTARTSSGDNSVFANHDFREEVYNAIEDDITKIMGFVKSERNSNSIKNSSTTEIQTSANNLTEVIDIAALLENTRSFSEIKKKFENSEAFNQTVLEAAIKELNNTKGDVPVASANISENTFEEFASRFKENKAIVLIASSFIDTDGNWDREGFKDFLNRCSGDKNSLLTKEELIAGVLTLIPEASSI